MNFNAFVGWVAILLVSVFLIIIKFRYIINCRRNYNRWFINQEHKQQDWENEALR